MNPFLSPAGRCPAAQPCSLGDAEGMGSAQLWVLVLGHVTSPLSTSVHPLNRDGGQDRLQPTPHCCWVYMRSGMRGASSQWLKDPGRSSDQTHPVFGVPRLSHWTLDTVQVAGFYMQGRSGAGSRGAGHGGCREGRWHIKYGRVDLTPNKEPVLLWHQVVSIPRPAFHPATPLWAGGAWGGRGGGEGRRGRPSERRRTGGSHALLRGDLGSRDALAPLRPRGVSGCRGALPPLRRSPGGSRAHRPSSPAAAPAACARGSAPASASAAPPAAPDAAGGGEGRRGQAAPLTLSPPGSPAAPSSPVPGSPAAWGARPAKPAPSAGPPACGARPPPPSGAAAPARARPGPAGSPPAPWTCNRVA